MDTQAFISLKKVSKSFPGVKALIDVDMEIRKGEIHALIGENGAGKSTLIKILSGVYQPDAGSEIYIDNEKIDGITPLISLKKGISIIYQDFSLFPNLTVAENIGIGYAIEQGTFHVSWKEMRELARSALDRLGIDISIDVRLDELSVAKQQLVAIARAIIYNARLIIMDEPTSSLSKHEVENLFEIMRKLKDDGISILFISHKLDELFAVSDRFTILRDGRYIGTFDEDELDNDAIVSMMVGRKIEYQIHEKRKCIKPILRVENLCKKGNFRDISFVLNRGEVLGITGLVGAGRTEVLEALFGLSIPDSGKIFLEDKEISITSPGKAIKYGISLVPENRLLEGIILKKTVTDNLLISNVSTNSNSVGLFSKEKIQQFVKKWIAKIDIRPTMPDIKAINLSGGNQQKVVIAKWLATNPKILLVDEPTNGIDIGSKSNTHQLFRDLAENGISIIMVSSELPEILAVCDRILVMKRGRITAELEGANVTQSDIMNKAILDVSTQVEA